MALPGDDGRPAEASGTVRPKRRISPLTRKILAVNLLAPVLLVVGALYLDTYEQGLLRSELESLRDQGEMIAAAVAESAVSGDPGSLGAPGSNMTSVIEGGHGYRLLPEQARHMVRRLSSHVGRRVRLFDARGDLLADSRYLFVSGRRRRGRRPTAGPPLPRRRPALAQIQRRGGAPRRPGHRQRRGDRAL